MNDHQPTAADADDFRWQAFFQRSTDPLFLLNRQRRLLSVNRAWEALAGLSAAQARGLVCRRQQAASPGDTLEAVLEHALCPPPEVLRGATGRVRRLLPGVALQANAPRWWDVEFLPLRDGDAVRGILGRITPVAVASPPEATPLPEKLVALRERLVGRHGMDLLSGETPAARRLAEQVRLAASLQTPALLVGEAGSGKTTVARIIHYQSGRREKAFVALDCARLPGSAIADLLFANGSTMHRQAAGTIYLREPQRLPRDLQQDCVAWLAAAESPRLLAGLCSDPDEEVRSGRLLPNLWCALSAFVVSVPPLRERLADLPLLVERFLVRAAVRTETAVTGLAPAAWEVLQRHSWPGNLGELYGVLSSACAAAGHRRLDAEHLPASLRLTQRLAETPGPDEEKPLPLDALLKETERRLILLALKRAKGNKSRAAELLGVWRQRLLRRMVALGLIEGEPLAELELEEDE